MITGSDESLDQSDQGSDGVPGHPQTPHPPLQPPQVRPPVLVIVGDDARHDDVVKVVEGGKPVAFVGSDHPTQKRWVVYDDHQPDRCCVL